MHRINPRILKPNEKQGIGRGFSTEELKKAGLNLQEARAIQLPIDFRRHTTHEENVETIKTHVASEKAKPKPAPKPTEKPWAKRAKEKPKS